MATGLLGRKVGMTRVYTEDGRSVGVTVIQAGPCVVVQKKTADKEGYDAVQVGFSQKAVRTGKKRHWPSKPLAGHFRKANVPPHEILRELPVENIAEADVGQELTVSEFNVGDRIDVTGESKGKGYQGPMKRHGFGGGIATHGSMLHRKPGAIGQAADPSRVLPGRKMAGQMGDQQVTVRNLQVVQVDAERNLLLVRGGIPGSRRGVVEIRPTSKRGK